MRESVQEYKRRLYPPGSILHVVPQDKNRDEGSGMMGMADLDVDVGVST